MPRGLQVAFSKVVQKMADERGRELLPTEITELFENTYFLNRNPRFNIVDYSITPDRSRSPAPPAPGKTQDTKNLMRVFDGVISVDGVEYKLQGRGNGPISSLANALRTVGVDLDVQDYKEHAVGRGRGSQAATYIECTAAGTEQQAWGVGLHEDVVQSSLIALLSAASSVSLPSNTVPLISPKLPNVKQPVNVVRPESSRKPNRDQAGS
jgi:2-isopropylmalate synthase